MEIPTSPQCYAEEINETVSELFNTMLNTEALPTTETVVRDHESVSYTHLTLPTILRV